MELKDGKEFELQRSIKKLITQMLELIKDETEVELEDVIEK